MAVAFPLSPIPSYYVNCSFPTRNGVFYVGDTPSVTLSKSGPTAYYVLDYWGTSVSSGSVSGTTCTPTAPSGGWKPGWYRIYFTGASTDALFGPSYGATNFVVIRAHANFVTMPAAGTVGGGGGESRDVLMKGVMGIGTSRLTLGDVTNLTTGADTLSIAQADVTRAKTYWSAPGSPYADTARPRPLFSNFPNGTVDVLALPGSASGTYLSCYAKTETVDGSQVLVSVAAGSVSGSKITVYSPTSATVVETYDNQASATVAAAAINAASAYLKVFTSNSATAAVFAATAISRTKWNGVVTAVTGLYPDVTRFEGPLNEPVLSAEIAHQMRLFQAAVHAGNSAALAIGPCPVDILNTTNWTAFLAAGGGNYCDEISFHAYNFATNGDINHGRSSIERFQALLATYGLQNKPLWQTEATQAITPVYGVYHPRRARISLMYTLLWEQYGLPRERNPVWYDVAHGFWSFPAFLENSDTSLNPQCALYRTLAEETFGQTHTTRLNFGATGERIYLGSVYTGTGGGTVVLMAASNMPGATITLTITGTTNPLTVVDGFGNLTTTPITNGKVTVPVAAIPSYVRLPTGVTATVYSCNDWPPAVKQGQSSSGLAAAQMGGTINTVINNGLFMTNYGSSTGISRSTLALPDTATLTWPGATRADRVIIWCGPSWQASGTLVDFDVQTTVDGTTWTTQATVTRPTPTSFQHGTSSNNTGCQRETYWDEQWIFDVPLPAPVTIKGLRLYVRAGSYGGEPDAACLTTGGQGGNPAIVLQEVAVLCDANTRPQYVMA